VNVPVTIAVVSWNTRELLRACLRSMEADHREGLAEVWVLDNGSDDGSAAMVEADFPWVSLIASEVNLGFGPAVNAVAERASGAWIAPANADVELTPGAIGRLIAAGENDPRAAIIAPRLVMADGRTQHSVHAFPTIASTILVNLSVERFSSELADRLCVIDHWDEGRRRRVDWAHGAFLLVRREAYDAVGGFDPDQWMYAEDLDLAWRLRKAGWATRYEPAATVRHAVSASTAKAWGDERARRSMAASYAWMARRRGLLTTWSVAAISITGALSRAGWYELLARRGGADRREEAKAEAERWRWHAWLHRLGVRRPRSIFSAR